MNRAIRLFCTMMLIASLSGCIIRISDDFNDDERSWKQRQERNLTYISHLDLGQSMNSIETDLGEADIIESFQRDGETYQVLYYRTQRVHGDGRTTRDEATPLVFIDKLLVGWGESAIEKATR